eukprot:CAMPEP_0194744056 /NCGR_PEP_ID=MMETSP0296-20130528/100650_1 /TAXON_ID=39354 /ORGANISM="Heterosigma akashiwo, Strain CCMP2393" /LENGTH=412 /DNA_ID=CAMNT_0039656151 /DNA_START=837 /DNA_END=2075 /DNA_ORIENTATION=-
MADGESSSKNEQPHPFFLHKREFFYPGLNRTFTIQQIYLLVDGTGGAVYDAANYLCKYLTSFPLEVDLTDKTILEVGAGVGLASSVIPFLRPRYLLCTDGEADLVPIIRTNVQKNITTTPLRDNVCIQKPDVEVFKWQDESGIAQIAKRFSSDTDNSRATPPLNAAEKLDFVICSDVIYNAEVIDELLKMLGQLIQELEKIGCARPQLLVAYQQRYPDEERRFFTELCDSFGYQKIMLKCYTSGKTNDEDNNSRGTDFKNQKSEKSGYEIHFNCEQTITTEMQQEQGGKECVLLLQEKEQRERKDVVGKKNADSTQTNGGATVGSTITRDNFYGGNSTCNSTGVDDGDDCNDNEEKQQEEQEEEKDARRRDSSSLSCSRCSKDDENGGDTEEEGNDETEEEEEVFLIILLRS